MLRHFHNILLCNKNLLFSLIYRNVSNSLYMYATVKQMTKIVASDVRHKNDFIKISHARQ